MFPPSKLRAVAIFAATKDIRYYLNGVYFCKAPSGDGIVGELLDSLRDLFEHCAMVHKHWGDGCNANEANAAQQRAHALIERLAP